MRSQNRAITADDFKARAEQAGGVKRAVALPTTHPDHPGVDVPGAVTVVIVPETKEVPPTPSAYLIRHVCNYLDRFRLLTAELFVKGPEYQEVRLSVRVAADPYAAFDAVLEAVKKALNESKSLNPFRQAFGGDLYPSSFYDVILDVERVRAVESLSIFVGGRPHEPLTRPLVLPPDGLVFGGDHEITVVPFEDR